MKNIEQQLALMGYEKETYLIGINQFISKEINIIKHKLMENKSWDFTDENDTVTLPDGRLLFTKKPSFWNYSFNSDVKIVDGEIVRVWRVGEYGSQFQEWVLGVTKETPYSEYSKYVIAMTDEVFEELLDKFFEKVTKLVANKERLPYFVAMLIHTGYQQDTLLAEIATNQTLEDVARFVDTLQKCEELGIPVTDYREVFNYS